METTGPGRKCRDQLNREDRVNRCIWMVSSDYVQHATNKITNNRGTIAVWLRPDGWSGGSYQAHGIFQTNSGVNSSNWLSLFKWYGNIFYPLGAYGSCCSNDLTFAPSSYLKNNQWVHLAATWNQDDNTMKVYFDGKLVASRTNINWSSPGFTVPVAWESATMSGGKAGWMIM